MTANLANVGEWGQGAACTLYRTCCTNNTCNCKLAVIFSAKSMRMIDTFVLFCNSELWAWLPFSSNNSISIMGKYGTWLVHVYMLLRNQLSGNESKQQSSRLNIYLLNSRYVLTGKIALDDRVVSYMHGDDLMWTAEISNSWSQLTGMSFLSI